MKHFVALIAALAASPAFAQPVVVSDSGDTAWVLTASALILMITIPGLAMFYGGRARAQNPLSAAMHCFVIVATVSLLWAVAGYSLVFGEGSAWLGGMGNAFLGNLADLREDTTLPESAFVLFQMTFAIITPALVIGAFAERIRLGWAITFSIVWSLLVYIPVARWVWGGGWLAELGVLDFAGGIVVHVTAGVAALVVALMLGRRRVFDETLPLHSPALTLVGAGLLWVGWFGLSGGSALSAGDDAATAILNTHFAACAAALVWLAAERAKTGKTTALGVATGAIAGLTAITPAAGFVGPIGAIALGALGGLVCFYAALLIKHRLKIDDPLNIFAVHGVGGVLGSLLFPFFILPALGGPGFAETTLANQLVAQLIGVGTVAAWTASMTWLFCFVLGSVGPMRVDDVAERSGDLYG